ncbi:MAG: diguanylate cyclase [Mariprofundaceae bacterium]|nr:diguanylate cyclase [Mariprofundaceae bacterium]
MKQSIKTKFFLVLIITLGLAFGLTFHFMSGQQQKLVMEQSQTGAEETAYALLASLETLMLAGDGNLAHDWLERVRRESKVEQVDVFRRDGSLAFRDLKTIYQVNGFLNTQAFMRPEQAPKQASDISLIDLKKAAQGEPIVVAEGEKKSLTFLLPIPLGEQCKACHGYDLSPIRGILRVTTSTAVVEQKIKSMRFQGLMISIVSMLLLGGVLFFYMRKWVITPISKLSLASERISNNDFNVQVDIQGNDEISILAASFNRMADRLQKTTVSKDYVDSIIASLGEMLLVTDHQGLILTTNPATRNSLGYSEKELIGMPVNDLLSTGKVLLSEDKQNAFIQNGDVKSIDVNFIDKQGQKVPVLVSISLLQGRSEKQRQIVHAVRDMTQQKKAERELRLAAKVMDTVSNAIMVLDMQGNIQLVNPAFSRITGYQAEEVLGKNPRILQSGRQSKEFYQQMWKGILDEGYWEGEIWNRRKNGTIYPEWLIITTIKDKHNDILHYVSTFLDITERKDFEVKLEYLANHDPLTELPNRLLFIDRLSHAMEVSKRSKSKTALIFIDIDGFKLVNDTHGHNVGDALLQEIATRLQGCVRTSDTVARVGGDEFVMIIENISDIDRAINIAEKALLLMRKTFIIDDLECQVGASLGLSIYPDDSEDLDELTKQADAAMYHAKKSGRNRISIYQNDLKQ